MPKKFQWQLILLGEQTFKSMSTILDSLRDVQVAILLNEHLVALMILKLVDPPSLCLRPHICNTYNMARLVSSNPITLLIVKCMLKQLK